MILKNIIDILVKMFITIKIEMIETLNFNKRITIKILAKIQGMNF